jgi:hypothetical protein
LGIQDGLPCEVIVWDWPVAALQQQMARLPQVHAQQPQGRQEEEEWEEQMSMLEWKE